MPIFRQNGQLCLFGPKFDQKWILWSEFQKSKSGFKISSSKIPCEPIFSQMGNSEFFGLNLGKLPNYLRCFGSNIVEGVVESWVEAEISWVEVGAWFSNTHSESFQEIPRKSFTARCIFKAHNVEGVAWMEVDGAGWS